MKGIASIVVILAIILLGAWFYFTSPPAPTQEDLQEGSEIDHQMMDDDNVSTSTSETSATSTVNEIDGAKEFYVTGTNFSFSTNKIEVKKGDIVRITFKSETGTHDLKIDEFNTATKILRASDPAETIEFVADKTGEFEFYCSVGSHRQMGMRGTLIVTE